MLSLAVVIPVLNEGASLDRTFASLTAQSERPDELIVSDGGSTDDTITRARNIGARVIQSTRGRGTQIAEAILVTQADVVLIGHADMVFPPTACSRVKEYLEKSPDCPGGCLGHTFDSPKFRYRVTEWFDRRRARTGASYGDQAQFFRRTALDRAGGFPTIPILEDLEVARRLRALGQLAYLDCPVIVSTRRFEKHGWLRTLLDNWRYRRQFQKLGLNACTEIALSYYKRPNRNMDEFGAAPQSLNSKGTPMESNSD